jgi:asparagine synthase (glutamine-hydrolysing)
MSGICGICEPGIELSTGGVGPMLDALALPGDIGRASHGGSSISLGVVRHWEFQQVAVVDHVSVVADADLMDFTEVAAVLSISPTAAASIPVGDLIARLYLQSGAEFMKLLHGAYTFALWDAKANRLLLSIDRFGVKSLYWRREGARLLFASRIGALRSAQRSPVEVNPAAVLQFLLFSAVPAPLAIDKGTEKLRPGVVLTYEMGVITERQYWDLEYPESTDTSVSRWARELREEMRAAVHRNLEGREESSTGCYLSGGTDSSSVVAFASEKYQPARSFSIAFEETGFSEIDFARTSAAAFGSDHHEKFLTAQDAASALDKIIAYFEEPFANSSAIGSYYCAVLAKESGVNTLLAGDGGDELFAGNERYATDKRFGLYHQLPSWLRRGLIEPLTKMLPDNGSKLSLPRRYVRRANIPNPRRILSYGLFLSLPPNEIFEGGFLEQVGVDHWLTIPEDHFVRAKATSELNKMLYLDVKMTLADNDLRKVSGTAEMAGVNVRYPFLDKRLAEFSGRIPSSLKLKGFEKRYIFKEAMKGILPQKILNKKKHGFGVPLAQWLLQNPRMRELRQDLLHDPRTRQRGYFLPSFFDRLTKLHSEEPNFYGEIVWYLLALELWHRQHLERSRDTVHAI